VKTRNPLARLLPLGAVVVLGACAYSTSPALLPSHIKTIAIPEFENETTEHLIEREITEAVIEDNASRWSGNHLMSPDVVPGILLMNRKLSSDGHDLTDVTATVLAHYGIQTLPGMTGKPIL